MSDKNKNSANDFFSKYFDFLNKDYKGTSINPLNPIEQTRINEIMRLRKKYTRVELIDILERTIKTGDKKALEKEIWEKSYPVYSANSPDVFKIYAIACLHAGNYELAIKSVKEASKNYKNSTEVLGMLHYSIKDYHNASIYLNRVKAPERKYMTLLLKAVSEYNDGNKDIYKYTFDLESILGKSSQANNFLGTLFYNDKNYEKASDYFIHEVLLLKDSKNTKAIEESRINALRVLYSTDKSSAIANFPEFYAITGSKLTASEITEKMDIKELPVPHYNINSLLPKITRELLKD
ncbi:MAG TPA: hypothetical protein VEC16_06475 [Alphaproteobacteria bacterium]|nr:hypothetical protein [Alphaproteobacteria bacterium]